jgi:hypothetical protein
MDVSANRQTRLHVLARSNTEVKGRTGRFSIWMTIPIDTRSFIHVARQPILDGRRQVFGTNSSIEKTRSTPHARSTAISLRREC